MIAYVIVIALASILIWIYRPGGIGQSCCSSCCEGCCNVTTDQNITNDPTTWPSGDRVWLICHAIAFAEGADKAGSVPDVYNNPGDLSDGFARFGGDVHSGSNVTRFPDKATGWSWLYEKWQAIINGSSAVYSVNMTWTEIAQKWAGDWADWVTNVTNTLGVSKDSTVQQYLNS